jgi:FkbM family methyltransferase
MLKDRLTNYIYSGQESVASQKMLQVLNHIQDLDVKCILDVGSWHLKQSMEFLNAFPDAQVHAFEPAPDNFNLCKNTHMYMDPQNRDRLKVYNVALGDVNGTIDFYVIDDTKGDSNAGAASKFKFKPGMNGSFYNQNWIQKQVTVSQYRLDDFVPKYINMPVDILWIDVQGAELFAFKGAERTLKDTKMIFTEVGLEAYYEGQSLKPQIDEYLNSLGFEEIKEAFELNGFAYEGNAVYKRI